MRSIPLLLFPAVFALGLLLSGAGFSPVWLAARLPSGAPFALDAGTLVLAIALLCLFVEVYKATRSSQASFVDHLLSLLLFVVLLLGFLLWPAAAHPVSALLVLMALIDVIAGFAIGMAVARRDVGIVRE